MPADIVVTGIGVVSPAGIGRDQTWRRLLANGRAVHRLAGGLGAEFAPLCGATIDGFRPPPGTEHLSRTCQLGVAAAEEALVSAELVTGAGLGRVAVSVGTSKPLVDLLLPSTGRTCLFSEEDRSPRNGSRSARNPFRAASLGGIRSASGVNEDVNPTRRRPRNGFRGKLCIRPPCGWFDFLPDAPARTICTRFGLGRVHATVSACSTGLHAIIHGAEMIRDGEAETVLAGSADSSLSPLWLATYRSMGVLAKEHPELGPAWACRPFDRDRDGFVVGEGAALMILESGGSAARRGVLPWGRLVGWAAGSDPVGLTQVSESGAPLAEVVQAALSHGSVCPQDVACVYAHGTATRQNDLAEINSLRRVFGRRLTSLPVVSTKGAIGHLMGAAGAVETALAVLARREGSSPGTATLVEPDSQFAGVCLPTTSFDLAAGAVLKTSLGFGGHLAAILIQKP